MNFPKTLEDLDKAYDKEFNRRQELDKKMQDVFGSTKLDDKRTTRTFTQQSTITFFGFNTALKTCENCTSFDHYNLICDCDCHY